MNKKSPQYVLTHFQTSMLAKETIGKKATTKNNQEIREKSGRREKIETIHQCLPMVAL